MPYQKVITLTDFILEDEKRFKTASGNFTLLLTHIENAAKILASHLKRTGLVDVLGKTGNKNAYGEEVEKLDEYANALLVDTLLGSGQVYAVASEELDEEIYSKNKKGDYIVCFDPLDGSGNIDINLPIGTIFSIYHKGNSLLQPGSLQIAAGYIIYSTSVMFVYTTGNGVNGFTLDPAIGSFLLSHPDIKIPEKGKLYSINEGSYELYDAPLKKYLDTIKKNQSHRLRYVGSMVADVHRTLLKGGIFLYPKNAKETSGKLRLLFEVNPMSFLVTQAGGMAVSDGGNPLEIVPQKVSHKAPIVLGSPEDVKEYIRLVRD